MPQQHNTTRLAAATAVAASALISLTACGGDSDRAATVSSSHSGAVVTGESTDLGAIVIGWGQQRTDTEITTPKPDQVSARCTGSGEALSVEINAPHGWNIKAHKPSQTITIANTDQKLAGDIDTTNRYLPNIAAVDWSEADQLDLAVSADAPSVWKSPHGAARVYVSLHVDCR